MKIKKNEECRPFDFFCNYRSLKLRFLPARLYKLLSFRDVLIINAYAQWGQMILEVAC